MPTRSFLFLVVSILLTREPATAGTTHRTIRPGEVRLLEFSSVNRDGEVYCRDRRVPSQTDGKAHLAFISESYFSKLSPFSCVLKVNAAVVEEIRFQVEPTDFPTETLKVSPKQIKLSAKDQARADAEQEMLQQVYAASAPHLLTGEKPFVPPLTSKVTSPYGIRRVFNGEMKGQHIGIDFRAPIGKKIPVANAGRVVFTGELFRSGNLVIVDHGLGVFTQYHHLSKILVKKGDAVAQGAIVGLAGNTGRVSGPHLHWGSKVDGELVSGFSLIKETETRWHPSVKD